MEILKKENKLGLERKLKSLLNSKVHLKQKYNILKNKMKKTHANQLKGFEYIKYDLIDSKLNFKNYSKSSLNEKILRKMLLSESAYSIQFATNNYIQKEITEND